MSSRDRRAASDLASGPAFQHSVVDGLLEAVAVPNVCHRGDDATVESPDLTASAISALGIVQVRHGAAEINRDDIGTLLRESQRVAPTLPPRCSGYEGDPARQG
jgi:hypothetical protein